MKRFETSTRMILTALLGLVVVALPGLGVGPDVSPSDPTYLERRYGNIGTGIALTVAGLLVALYVLGIGIAVRDRRRRARLTTRTPD